MRAERKKCLPRRFPDAIMDKLISMGGILAPGETGANRPKGGEKMNSYELLYIIKPTVEEEARAALIAKFADIVKNDGGEIENIDEWGMRKLAYAIDYISEGYYVLVNFKAKADLPAELERNLKISEDVMRFMIVKKEQE